MSRSFSLGPVLKVVDVGDESSLLHASSSSSSFIHASATRKITSSSLKCFNSYPHNIRRRLKKITMRNQSNNNNNNNHHRANKTWQELVNRAYRTCTISHLRLILESSSIISDNPFSYRRNSCKCNNSSNRGPFARLVPINQPTIV